MDEKGRLLQLEAWWSSVWELEPHAILVTDARGRIKAASAALYLMIITFLVTVCSAVTRRTK